MIEAERWAKYLFKKYPEADEEVVLLSVWLHDLGYYPIPTKIDQAVRSEERAKNFLEKENYSKEKIKKVFHCVRSHRSRDIIPDSLETKIIARIDSTSHMTTSMYFDMAEEDKTSKKEFRVYAKMNRDYQDLNSFPEIKKELTGIYKAWQELIKNYEKIELE